MRKDEVRYMVREGAGRKIYERKKNDNLILKEDYNHLTSSFEVSEEQSSWKSVEQDQ